MRTEFALFFVVSACNARLVSLLPVMRREENMPGDYLLQTDPIVEDGQAALSHYVPPEDTCNNDYLLGFNNTNECLNSTHHRLIMDEGMCIRAANLTGAGLDIPFFKLDETWQDLHPKGCFLWECDKVGDGSSTDKKWCFYYNPGENPLYPRGHPVCYRAEYVNGTQDTNGGCDPGYQRVMDEQACADAAECLGFATENEFRIGDWNWTKHDEYPKGCFIRTDTGAFQFNNVSSLHGAEPAHPEIGGGIPICNVSHKTNAQSEA